LALVALLAEAPAKKERKNIRDFAKIIKTGQLSRRKTYI
jgi:hypothetical protein